MVGHRDEVACLFRVPRLHLSRLPAWRRRGVGDVARYPTQLDRLIEGLRDVEVAQFHGAWATPRVDALAVERLQTRWCELLDLDPAQHGEDVPVDGSGVAVDGSGAHTVAGVGVEPEVQQLAQRVRRPIDRTPLVDLSEPRGETGLRLFLGVVCLLALAALAG